jgi:hypothetical protein
LNDFSLYLQEPTLQNALLLMMFRRCDIKREYKRVWAEQNRKKNPLHGRIAAAKWRMENPEKALEAGRRFQAKHKEERAAKARAYHAKNREICLAKNKAYCQRTKPARNAAKRKSAAKMRAEKSNGYLAYMLRNRVLRELKGKTRAGSAIKLLGCPLDLFKLHLQSKFRDGMAWNNHGKLWHIDHIKPCAAFDLSKHEQQQECFHYSNMQPLLAIENLRKGFLIVKG